MLLHVAEHSSARSSAERTSDRRSRFSPKVPSLKHVLPRVLLLRSELPLHLLACSCVCWLLWASSAAPRPPVAMSPSPLPSPIPSPITRTLSPPSNPLPSLLLSPASHSLLRPSRRIVSRPSLPSLILGNEPRGLGRVVPETPEPAGPVPHVP
jgi:hypothetical protein